MNRAMTGPLTVEEEALRREFNDWAAAGRGDEMREHHSSIAEQTLALMALKPGERVLDLSCGVGWATRLMARKVAGAGPRGEEGSAIGVDLSDEMIARARVAADNPPNVLFAWGAAEKIPWRGGYFDKALSIEAFYYYPDQEAVLRELWRVLAPEGRVYLLINLYTDNPYTHGWVDELNTKVHLRSEAEYLEMMRGCGFVEVEARRVPDLTPSPEVYEGKWFADAHALRECKRIGALLLIGRK